MWNKKSIIKPIITLALFLGLEILSFNIIRQNNSFQQHIINNRISEVKLTISGFFSDIYSYTDLKKKNAILHQENSELRNRIAIFQTLHDSTKLLSAHINLPTIDSTSIIGDFSFIPAEVISNSTNMLNNYLIINKGSKDGVRSEMGVISKNGIIGIVSNTSDRFSRIESFLSVGRSVSAKVIPSNSYGNIVWDGKSPKYAILNEIPHHIEVNVGDTVVTSGFSTMYPKNIPIGEIESHVKKGSHHHIIVRLFIDYSSLKYVYVAINNNKEEIEQLTK